MVGAREPNPNKAGAAVAWRVFDVALEALAKRPLASWLYAAAFAILAPCSEHRGGRDMLALHEFEAPADETVHLGVFEFQRRLEAYFGLRLSNRLDGFRFYFGLTFAPQAEEHGEQCGRAKRSDKFHTR
jgi:hypothetical protein